MFNCGNERAGYIKRRTNDICFAITSASSHAGQVCETVKLLQQYLKEPDVGAFVSDDDTFRIDVCLAEAVRLRTEADRVARVVELYLDNLMGTLWNAYKNREEEGEKE